MGKPLEQDSQVSISENPVPLYVVIFIVFWEKRGKLFKGDITQGRILIKKIRYIHTSGCIQESYQITGNQI